MHYQTKSSETLAKMRRTPQIDLKLPDPGPLRDMIEQVSINGGQGESKTWDGGSEVKTVYYLYGDERRAIRKFIKQNQEFVKDCMGSDAEFHPINQTLEDDMWDIFQEEYEVMEHTGEI